MNLTYIKENFYKITTVVAIIVLIGMQGKLWVKAQNSDANSSSETNALSQISDDTANNELSPNLPNVPNAFCLSNLQHWEGGSNTYNPNTPYNTVFFNNTANGRYSSYLQDINGDNLPDYIYSFSDTSNAGTNLYGTDTQGCVFLNNGTGWTKVFECITASVTNSQTGQVVSQNYKGDCAGTPTSNEQDVE